MQVNQLLVLFLGEWLEKKLIPVRNRSVVMSIGASDALLLNRKKLRYNAAWVNNKYRVIY